MKRTDLKLLELTERPSPRRDTLLVHLDRRTGLEFRKLAIENERSYSGELRVAVRNHLLQSGAPEIELRTP
jgi:hypothetical protein